MYSPCSLRTAPARSPAQPQAELALPRHCFLPHCSPALHTDLRRLLAQLAATLGLLCWGALPQPWGPQLTSGAALLSLASLAFLSTQLAQLRQASHRAKAGNAAATTTEGAVGVSEAGQEGKKAA